MKKFIPLLLFALAPIFAMSQATTLFISEFAEGSSQNKYLEIYNGTGTPVDLSFFSLSSCSNGCNTFGQFDFPDNVTFAPGTMLADGAVYVIAHPSADPLILAVADQTFNFLSNGDDLFALTLAGATASVYTIIDILGDMQDDPGTNWPVAGVSPGTQNKTLVRKSTVCIGNPNELASFGTDALNSEWIVYPQNFWDSLDMHVANCAPVGCNTFGSTTQISCGPYTGPSGTIFTTTGLFTDTIPNAAFCDSIIAIDLTVNPIYTVAATDSACTGVSYTFGTQTLTVSGPYTELFTSISGCDSTVNLDMTFLTAYTTNVSASICSGESYVLGTQTLTASGPYTELFMAVGGCDSTVNLTLTVIPNSTATVSPIVCNSYTSPSGNIWTMSNTYLDTIQNAAGCDSVITINLTVNMPTSSSISQSACDSYTMNTTTYTASGVYTQITTNAVGCDSTITLTLDITPTPATPSAFGTDVYCAGDALTDMTATSNTGFDSLIISGVADATLPGGLPKCVEFYALYDIPDLSIYGFGSANNGGGTDGEEYTFPVMPLTAGSYFRVATDSTNFMTFYGIFPNDLSSASNINGDDAIELFKNTTVIDVFGDINVDGTNQPWEYLDGWAYRSNNNTTNGGVWSLDGWFFSGRNALDGASDNATSGSPFPIGTYSYTAPTSTMTWYTDAALTAVFGTGSPITPGASTQTYYVAETLTGGTSCESTSSMVSITVNALPTVTFGALTDMCVYNNSITLSQGSPAGGTYSGNGVTGISFDPATAGNGTHTLTYSYTDATTGCTNTATSDIFVDACASISEINVNSVNVFPNPSKGLITITFEGEKATIVIVDLKGQTLSTNAITSNEKVDLSALSSGTYFVKVTVEGSTHVERIIIE
ncbi:MAG: lamin tail domain-containing protein [Fluviicola sp.]|nr:lamin tail domain-containing protein [Fluviicola sp.]